MDVNKAFFVEILGVDHGAVNVGEHLEFGRASNVVAITAGAIAHNFLAGGILTHLPRLEGLDHAVLLRHTADPFVAFNRHLFVFPTFFDARQHCKVPSGNVRINQGFCVRTQRNFGQSGLNFALLNLQKKCHEKTHPASSQPIVVWPS